MKIIKKINVGTPEEPLVNAYLGEIAKAYGVDWMPPAPDDDQDVGRGPALKVSETQAPL